MKRIVNIIAICVVAVTAVILPQNVVMAGEILDLSTREGFVSADEALLETISEGDFDGVILGKEALIDRYKCVDLISDIQGASHKPLRIYADLGEGAFGGLPSTLGILATGKEEYQSEAESIINTELKSLGINMGISIPKEDDDSNGEVLSREDQRRAAEKVALDMEIKDKKWEIEKAALTLLRNEGQVLPVHMKSGNKAVIFVENEEDIKEVDLAISMLSEEGKINGNSGYRCFSYKSQKSLTDEIKSVMESGDSVLIVTSGDYPQEISDYAHEKGKRVSIVYTGEPENLHIANAADALMLTWGGSVRSGVYGAFGGVSPSGTLPIDITDANGEIIYPKGYGLHEDFEEALLKGPPQNPMVWVVIILIVGVVVWYQYKRNKQIPR